MLAATGLVVANAQEATAQSADQSAAERCSEFHLFGAEPVDVAKSGDGETVLAQASWGHHDSIGCYLALDGDAVSALRAAGPPQSLPQGQTDASTRCFEHHRFGAEPVDAAKTADGQTVLARLSWGFSDSIGCFLALDPAAVDTLRAAATPPATAPGAPGNVMSVAGDGRLAVTWAAPDDDGGARVIDYTVAYMPDAAACPTDIDITWNPRIVSTTSATIGGLTNGVAYRVCVRANNRAGAGGWDSTTAIPATAPGAPGNVMSVAGDGRLAVTWAAPDDDGGARVIDYTVAYMPDAAACPTDIDITWNPRIVSTTSATIGGLTNGVAYRVCVRANNRAGAGGWDSTTAIPATAPGAPGNVMSVAGDGQLAVTWAAPDDDGGAPIIGYTVAYRANAFTCPASNAIGAWTVRTTSTTSITIGSLANNNAYRACVRATNSAGNSGWSGTTNSPSDRPGQPTGVQILSTGPDQLTVAWTAPVATGGSAITGYNVQWCTASNNACASSWSSASATGASTGISGLTGSTSYGVRVQAVSSRGTGRWSSTLFAGTTAATAPGTPTGLAATIDDRQIELRWNVPPANGAPITRYTVECRLGGTAIATGNCGSRNWIAYATAQRNSATISALANGTAYEIRVRATNRAGNSAWATVSATPAARPRIPANVRAATSGRDIQVTWTAPASGGSPITLYTVESCSGDCGTWRTTSVGGNPPATTTTLTGLASGTTYRVRVRATNAAGESGWSAIDTATTPTRPGTPTNLQVAVGGPDTLTATWTAPVSPSGITGYTVQRCNAAANQDGTWRCSGGWGTAGTAATTSHTITGLNGSTAYLVRVQAFNAAGSSGWVTSASGATTDLPTVPETPTGFTATPGNRQIRLSWTAPPARGARITRYTITCSGGSTATERCGNESDPGSVNYRRYNTFTTSGTSYTISGLTNGVTYSLTVLATNSAGDGSTASASAVPATRPGPPRNIAITESYGTGTVNLSVSWEAPSRDDGTTTDDGGSAITGYTVQYRASTGNWSFAYFGNIRDANNPLPIPGLTVGPRYYVQIRTHNAGGDSSWVQASTHPTGTPAQADVPGLSNSTLGELEATWSAFTSANQGASEVTDYDVRWSTSRTVTVDDTPEDRCNNSWRYAPDTGDEAADTSTSYTITDLNGDTRYCVQIRAANIHGNGPWSDSAYEATLPAVVPGTIDDLTATPGDRRATLSWTAPAANGARITRYTITCNGGSTATERCGNESDTGSVNYRRYNTYTTSGTSYTISGLTNGVSYTFMVLATNSAGDGSTASAPAVPATRPNRPDPSDITFSEAYANNLVNLTVTWVAPEDSDGSGTSGGSAITGYTLQYRTSGSNWSFHYFGTGTTTEITGLAIGRRYDVQIRTHTAAGESSWTQKSVTPTGRPGAPTSIGATGGANSVTASWSEPTATGASTITGYNVQRCTVTVRSVTIDGTPTDTYTCGGWTSAGTVAATESSFPIGNLPCGRRIGVRVQAVNSYGAGPWSETDRESEDWSAVTEACPS
ncbi:MAG: fibronectin type III domain-containing protein [bacterium]|nr:fibronectin type III domain-containing protein [bacterium]